MAGATVHGSVAAPATEGTRISTGKTALEMEKIFHTTIFMMITGVNIPWIAVPSL